MSELKVNCRQAGQRMPKLRTTSGYGCASAANDASKTCNARLAEMQSGAKDSLSGRKAPVHATCGQLATERSSRERARQLCGAPLRCVRKCCRTILYSVHSAAPKQ
eukprot:4836875-Pleurochrysis_carterae.AAC.3